MHCSNCGAALSADTSFCAACGTPVAPAAPAAPAAPVNPTVYNNAPYTNSAPAASTNGLAIASLVTSILCCVPVGQILGHVALSQINKTGQQGRGMAIAGVVIGWVFTAGLIIWAIGWAAAIGTSSYYSY